MGRIEAICISREKGTVKETVTGAELRVKHGIVGDAHAGDWHRQVSLLPSESIAKVRDLMPELADGAFAENLVTSGIDLGHVRIGDKVSIGDHVLLEVTQIGKECHHGCAIRQITGDCIMPREGIFCRVLQGGNIQAGSSASLESSL
ncbi:MAG: MOSC domain-containing protein [Candidatus Krumholzibacteriota bacterium]